MKRRDVLQGLGAMLLAGSGVSLNATALHTAPPVMLATTYADGIELADFWISEKYDGVRAWWTGRELLTRSGHPIHAPAWFVAGWPTTSMDGELWIDRGRFERVSGIVRREQPDDDWRSVKYMVFDLPAHTGAFDSRLVTLNQTIASLNLPWVQAVKQVRLDSHEMVTAKLAEVVRGGGEGLMLHRGSSPYTADRSDDLLKLKPYEDAEAQVVGYVPGKGKYLGQVGALRVRTRDGTQFSVGSGLSDAQRRQAPPIGSWITYGHHGVTARGIPRFARFVRTRNELSH